MFRQRDATRQNSVAKRQTRLVDSGYRTAVMDEQQKFADLKALARIAARLAGRDADEHIVVRIGDVVAFDDVAWRYPDFAKRAEAAYKLLDSGCDF